MHVPGTLLARLLFIEIYSWISEIVHSKVKFRLSLDLLLVTIPSSFLHNKQTSALHVVASIKLSNLQNLQI